MREAREQRGPHLEELDNRRDPGVEVGQPSPSSPGEAADQPPRRVPIGSERHVAGGAHNRLRRFEVVERTLEISVAQEQTEADEDPATSCRFVVAEQGERALVAVGRRDIRAETISPVTGHDKPISRARVVSPLEMVGDRIRIGLMRDAQSLPDLPVQPPAPSRRETLIQRLADQGVGEAHALAVLLDQQPRLRGPLHDLAQRVLVHVIDRRPKFRRYLLAYDGGDRQYSARLLAQTIESTIDHLSQQRRNLGSRQGAQPPGPGFPGHRAGLFEGTQHFADEQGVSLSSALDIGGKRAAS